MTNEQDAVNGTPMVAEATSRDLGEEVARLEAELEVGSDVYQKRRKSSVFWRSGEATWYDLDAPKEGTPR